MTYQFSNLYDFEILQKAEKDSKIINSETNHASLYKLAVGQSVPTFKAISYLVPYFAPAEWWGR